MITRQHLSHILEPNMRKTTDLSWKGWFPSLVRRAPKLLLRLLGRLVWLAAWITITIGVLASIGLFTRLVWTAFKIGWSVPL